jgi:hypothetical protein
MPACGWETPTVPVLTVFVSSPGDVLAERRAALEVLLALPRKPSFLGSVSIVPILWDDPDAPAPLRADESPQRTVNRFKRKPSECDLTLVILWGRMGTPVGELRKPDGSTYGSGTEWEFEDARAAGRPIIVYHRDDPSKKPLDDQRFPDAKGQFQAAKEFVQRIRQDKAAAGINAYKTAKDFRQLLEKHLEAFVWAWLQERRTQGVGQRKDEP